MVEIVKETLSDIHFKKETKGEENRNYEMERGDY
jgi:hypothetical protein